MPNVLYVPKILGLTWNLCVSREKRRSVLHNEICFKIQYHIMEFKWLTKKSIPAWEGYDEVDNLFYGFPNHTKGPPA